MVSQERILGVSLSSLQLKLFYAIIAGIVTMCLVAVIIVFLSEYFPLLVLGTLLILFVCLAVYSGLTARNKARILTDERNKVAHLLKNLPGIAYQAYDQKHWPMILVSEGCEIMTGFTKQDFESHDVLWGNIIHPEDYDRVFEIVNSAVKEKNFYELEYRILTKNKEIRLVWERGESYTSQLNNKVILEGFITDITHIKHAERELVNSHEFSNAIVNSVVEAVITIDHEGYIKSFNRAAQNMFGYCFDEIKDTKINRLMPSLYAEHHDQYLAHYLRTGQTHIIGRGRELEAMRKGGSVFPVHLSISHIQSQDDTMFVGLIRDITLQRANEDQRRMHIEQLAHADRLNSLGEMAAGIAHEVSQPLTAISLFSQSGKSFCNSNQFDKLPDIFDRLSKHSQRAGAVLERMQVLTKQGERKKEIVSCYKLIDEVFKLVEHDVRTQGIVLTVEHEAPDTTLFIDLVQIQQVLLNLLRNGMEAMRALEYKNGNIIQISTQVISTQSLKICVADSGCGLSSEITKKLFTAFSSTKKNGMGIGLSISKSIVEEHGGSIHYLKNNPVGSIFYFVLPIFLDKEAN